MSPQAPPLVSVAMATYNGARHLRDQLDSIYRQTWPNLEVVVTDDGSVDGTPEILQEYARLHGLRWEANPARLGLAKNFERAISLCRGDFIALSDQDDLWKPHKIERLVQGIGEHSLIYCNTQEYVEGDGEPRVEAAFEPIFRFARDQGSGRPTRHLIAENWVVCHSLMLRRDVAWHALPIPPTYYFPDGWLALVASKLGGLVYLDERLQIYRRHAESLTFKAPGTEERPSSFLATLLSGGFREQWRHRCEAETARLRDVLALPLLDDSDRDFVRELMTYYGSGLSRGIHWRALLSGLRVVPFVSTLYRGGARWKFPLRALLGGL